MSWAKGINTKDPGLTWKQTKRFRYLAVKEATGTITKKQHEELNRLSKKRDYYE